MARAIQPVTIAPLSLEQARDLTDEVKADAAALWSKLLTLYEGKAHEALGYTSWADYYTEEFGESKSHGYRLLEAARVDRALTDSPMGERPASERVAREMAPVLKDEGPEAVEEVWGEVVEEHGPAPTAAQVREVVETHRAPESATPEPEYTSCPTCGHRVRADKPLRPRKETS
jgi:hypothetical protein